MCSMFNKSKDINSVQNWNGKFSYQCLCFSLPPAIPGNKLILHYFPSTGWLFCDMAADFSQSKREIWESEAGAEVPLVTLPRKWHLAPSTVLNSDVPWFSVGGGYRRAKSSGSMGLWRPWQTGYGRTWQKNERVSQGKKRTEHPENRESSAAK